MKTEKVSTGVRRLDEMLDGGIPQGSIVLVAGSSGTGKTILGLQYLFDGARKGERGVYISHTEERSSIIKNLEGFSFFSHDILEKGLVKIIDSSVFSELDSLEENTSAGVVGIFKDIVETNNPKRVVVDSITSICDLFGQAHFPLRKLIFDLRRVLRVYNTTTLLLSEIPPLQVKYSKYGMEEFVSDGIILLQDINAEKQMKRSMIVMKMRGVAHSRDVQAVIIKSDGIMLETLIGE